MSEQESYRTGTCQACGREKVRIRHFESINKDLCLACASGMNSVLRGEPS
jgi:hypothetical protein